MPLFSIAFTLRTLRRRRSFAIASLLGLGIGTAACLMAALFVRDELSFDQYHVNKNRIHRLVNLSHPDTPDDGVAKINGHWGKSARTEIPEVEEVTRFVIGGQRFVETSDKRLFENNGFYVDPSVFRVFSFTLTEGNPDLALVEPNTIVLTQSMRRKYFGTEPVLGQTMIVDAEPYRVTGVMEDVPANSHFTFSCLYSMESLRNPLRDTWVRWNQYYTFLLLRPDADPAVVPAKMKRIIDLNVDKEVADNFNPYLQPLTSIHLYSQLFREVRPNSSVAYVYLFASIAFLILTIACINFINLSMAQGTSRAKEIGVRKVNGALRTQLIGQFLRETLLITAAAVLLANGIVVLALPYLNSLTGKSLTLDYTEAPGMGLIVLSIAGFTALIAGLLPALRLSSLRPVFAMKSQSTPGGAATLRKSLVAVQFALSSILVIASAVILNQLEFIQRKPSGFDPQQVITIPIHNEVFRLQHEAVKKELSALPGVISVSASGNLPGGSDWGIPAVAEGFTSETMPDMRVLAVDPTFLETYGITLVDGRSFSPSLASDSVTYLINEEAARQLQWNEPLKKTMAMIAIERPIAPVIGVVRDFHFRSLHENIGPLLFIMPPSSWYATYSIRIAATDADETIRRIEQTWKQFDPAHPFEFSYFDDGFRRLHEQDQRLGKLVNLFSGVGVFLACLGLYSLAALTTGQRTKEIGIRKVIGASTAQIINLLALQYVRLVIIGFAIALPVALWVSARWLESFAYRDNLPAVLIAVGCLSLAVLALLTVAGQSIGAARRNPVNALRSE